MTFSYNDLNDQEFLLILIDDYLNGSLEPNLKNKYTTLLQNEQNQNLLKKFSLIRGKIQSLFNEHHLDVETIEKIKNIVDQPETRHTRELQKIKQIEKVEAIWDMLKKAFMILIIISIIFVLVYYFAPPIKPKLDILSTIAQEALVITEDPEGRIDFPTNNLNDIHNYIKSDKSLEFTPKTFKSIPENWKIQGASIINYDIEKIKIITIQLTNLNTQEKLYQFIFMGELSDLPKTEKGNYRGLIYQAYTNDYFNLVVWQIANHTLSALVGKLSGSELAYIAKTYF